MRCGNLKGLFSSQVILWLERNDSRSQLSSRVELRDANTLINASENVAMFRQISRVVIKADLLRYEVFLIKYFEFPTRLAQNKDTIEFALCLCIKGDLQ